MIRTRHIRVPHHPHDHPGVQRFDWLSASCAKKCMQYVCNVMEYCHVLYAYRYSDLACGMLLSSNKYKKRPACLSKSIESSLFCTHARRARAAVYSYLLQQCITRAAAEAAWTYAVSAQHIGRRGVWGRGVGASPAHGPALRTPLPRCDSTPSLPSSDACNDDGAELTSSWQSLEFTASRVPSAC